MFFKNQKIQRYALVTLSAFLIGMSQIAFISSVHANPPADGGNAAGSNSVSVVVTEQIPGAKCVSIGGNGVATKKYRCDVQSGFGSVVALFGTLIKYATFVTALLGVLMIVFSGFQYATSAGDTKQQSSAVQRIQKLIGGLVLLFLMGLILNTVAPWIYR